MNNGIYDEKESFLLYTSFYGLHFADLSNEEKGVLIDCIFQYTLTGRTNFEELEEDRGLKVSFRSIIDVIDRNNAKWAESKERRSNGNKKAWAKRKLGDSRTIEMPNDSFITLKGNIANMPSTFDELKDRKFDGMVITGAPVENLPFEEVDYWQELCEIMEWSKTHVHSTFHICWGAQAGLYYHYGIDKHPLEQKLFGVFEHTRDYPRSILLRGFDDNFWAPHSRHTTVLREEIEAVPELKILASSKDAGVYAIMSKHGRHIFVTGHSEYDPDTLEREYLRDKNAGLPISVPENYYPNDDDTQAPIVRWRGHANLLFSNWLNYFVYQTTPFDITSIGNE